MGSELFSNQLSGTIPSTIGGLTNLQALYEIHFPIFSWRWQGLSLFTDSIWLIRLFDDRYLFSNQLSGTIPSTIGGLTKLVDLYGNHHRILLLTKNDILTSQPMVDIEIQRFVLESTVGNHSIVDWIADQPASTVRAPFIGKPSR